VKLHPELQIVANGLAWEEEKCSSQMYIGRVEQTASQDISTPAGWDHCPCSRPLSEMKGCCTALFTHFASLLLRCFAEIQSAEMHT